MNEKRLLFIELPTSAGSELVNPEDIISIRAKDKSICLIIENQPEKILKLPIGKVEKLLPAAYFARCHRCHIVNVLKIRGRIKKQSCIVLSNGQQIPVSQTHKKQLDETLNQYCKKIEGVTC